ncbi:carotenoid oxygenase [Podospora appendiculata]|uniref:Carotenoid oxygenase n=1 Tax=Podospora appendiculata TaxID=314037 RepID=A0AAE0X281_9PEZI|nr:carotenoid oxygenase [Podospora appendiculata]
MVDPFYPLQEGNPPVEGDGNMCAFRIAAGRVDMKVRYVDTERLRLERAASKRLFGLYRNPFSHHPCVRAAVDSTANTNLVHWAGRLLALKESALPYAVDPTTLETLAYDPFSSPGKTFSAHPKVDPRTGELVVFGYEAKGLGTRDIVVYALDQQGAVRDEQWLTAPWPAFIHDCALTANFVVLVLWPYDADVAKMEAGGQHWTYNKDRGATFVVVPRRAGFVPPGWAAGERHRVYHWDHALLLHTAGAWEEEEEEATGTGITLRIESSRLFYNVFPELGARTDKPFGNMQADYVRWTLDLGQPDGTRLADPEVILDMPGEMARIDERFLTQPYTRLFCPVVVPGKACPVPPVVPLGLNGYLMLDKASGATTLFDPGFACTLEEPAFVPRSPDAAEGDGWLLGMVQRLDVNRSDLVVLDTNDITKPVAVVQLPFRLKSQIHGNWVDAVPGQTKALARAYADDVKVSGRGALETESK